jgi:hypothetical protein
MVPVFLGRADGQDEQRPLLQVLPELGR